MQVLAKVGGKVGGVVLQRAIGVQLNLKLAPPRNLGTPLRDARLFDAERPRQERLRPEMLDCSSGKHGTILGPPNLGVNRGTFAHIGQPMPMSKSTLAERAVWARENAGLTPAEAARRIGISQPSLSDIESGETKSLRGKTPLGPSPSSATASQHARPARAFSCLKPPRNNGTP